VTIVVKDQGEKETRKHTPSYLFLIHLGSLSQWTPIPGDRDFKGQEMEPSSDDLANDLLLSARLTARRAVDSNDCWIWTGAKTSKGYGHLWFEGRLEYVHRLSAILFLSFAKDSDLCVRHDCDVPSCFNPAHLRPGTKAENMEDAARKGRMAKKLTPQAVLEIRRRLKLGETQASVAEDYPVSKTTIGQIARGETWKHLPEPEPEEASDSDEWEEPIAA
jgi:hypothetical protein